MGCKDRHNILMNNTIIENIFISTENQALRLIFTLIFSQKMRRLSALLKFEQLTHFYTDLLTVILTNIFKSLNSAKRAKTTINGQHYAGDKAGRRRT